MIPLPAGMRIWLASGHTDMRRGMRGLALQVQEDLGREPFGGDVFFFADAAGLWSRRFGMMASDYPFLPSGWTRGGLSGRRRRTVLCPSQPVRSVICLKGSTGEIRNKPGVRSPPGSVVNRWKTRNSVRFL